MEQYKQDLIDKFIEHPVQNKERTWDALDGNGYGHILGYETEEMVEIWLRGYDVGSSENM